MKRLFLMGVFVVLFSILGLMTVYGFRDRLTAQALPSPLVKTITEMALARHPLMIEQQRLQEFPGSELQVIQELSPAASYTQSIVSYQSEGLEIQALLTVPVGEKPAKGWPAIVFNHGYIPPEEYKTTERYESYLGAMASRGYVVLRPDYRGHGSSEGEPEGAYLSPGYTTDVLNALGSLKQLPDVNKDAIGMWGHSMGGFLTMRSMVISPDVKAGVVWAGAIGSYGDLYRWWREFDGESLSSKELGMGREQAQEVISLVGEPDFTSQFWKAISFTSYLADLSGPVQIHHGTADTTVPLWLAQNTVHALEEAQKEHEFYQYEGGDHNLSGSDFGVAMQRTLEFFDRNLKES